MYITAINSSSRCGVHSHLCGVRRQRVAGVVLFSMLATQVLAQAPTPGYRWDLNRVAESALPPGWGVDATNPSGPLARWQVHTESVPSGSQKRLSIDQIQDRSPAVFNLCWTRQPVFLNGEIQVRVRANSGQIDQGGGVTWRVQDAKNYYVARYNPLEKNFRLYFVQHGKRTQLASHDVGYQAQGGWVKLRIAHEGERIRGWINDLPAWDVLDATLIHAGGVGLWTKADAATSFVGFEVRQQDANRKLNG